MPFHLWSTDTPEYIETFLPVFAKQKSYSNQELVDVSTTMGETDVERRISHLNQFWYTLGLLDRNKDGHKYIYSISEFGEKILPLLNFNAALCFDILHFALINAWKQDQHENWGWSWVYRAVGKLLWKGEVREVDSSNLLARVNDLADQEIPDFRAKINPIAMGTSFKWMSSLTPPFLIKDDPDKSDRTVKYGVQRREFCNPELILLAVCLEYQGRGIPFGSPLVMDEGAVDSISETCLLDNNQFWPVMDLADITFNNLVQKKETLYGTSILLAAQPDFYPPDPRLLEVSDI